MFLRVDKGVGHFGRAAVSHGSLSLPWRDQQKPQNEKMCDTEIMLPITAQDKPQRNLFFLLTKTKFYQEQRRAKREKNSENHSKPRELRGVESCPLNHRFSFFSLLHRCQCILHMHCHGNCGSSGGARENRARRRGIFHPKQPQTSKWKGTGFVQGWVYSPTGKAYETKSWNLSGNSKASLQHLTRPMYNTHRT